MPIWLELPDGTVATLSHRSGGKMGLCFTGFVGQVVIHVQAAATHKRVRRSSELEDYLPIEYSNRRRTLYAIPCCTTEYGVLRITGNNAIRIPGLEAIDPVLVTSSDVVVEIRGQVGSRSIGISRGLLYREHQRQQHAYRPS